MNETVLDCDNKCVQRKQEEGKQPILPRAGPPALIRLWRVYALFKLHLLLCEITKMDKGVPASAFCMCCCIAAAHWSLCPRLEALWGHVRSKTSAPVSSVYAAQPELTGDESNYSRPAFSLFISFINPKILHKSSIGWGGATQKDAVLSPANERRIVRSLHLSPGFHAPSLTLSYFSLSLSLSASVHYSSQNNRLAEESIAQKQVLHFQGVKGRNSWASLPTCSVTCLESLLKPPSLREWALSDDDLVLCHTLSQAICVFCPVLQNLQSHHTSCTCSQQGKALKKNK